MNKEAEKHGEGYTAYQRGVTECPYERLTANRENWWMGWENARYDDIIHHEEWR